MREIDKVALLYTENGKILSTRSAGKDAYYLPGGKREMGESDPETLCREIREELSVEIRRDTLRYYGTFTAQAHGKGEGVQVKMTCYQAQWEGALAAASEIEEIVWLAYSDIHKVSPVDQLIFRDLKEKGLLD